MVCLLIVSVLAAFEITSIKTVKVITQEPIGQVLGLSEIDGKLLFVDTHTIEQYVTKRNPQISDVMAFKKYPNTIELLVEEREPYAVLTVDAGYFTLSEEGIILSKSRDKPKDTLINFDSYQKLDFSQHSVGEEVDFSDFQTALFFARHMTELGFKPSAIDIAGFHVIALRIGPSTIRFSVEKPKELQLYQVETILRDLAKRQKRFSVLDVRFEKPVMELAEDGAQ